MKHTQAEGYALQFRRLSQVAAWSTTVAGAVVLFGWAMGITAFGDRPVLLALGFLLLGIALALLQARPIYLRYTTLAGRICAGLALALGTLILASQLFALDFGINALFYLQPPRPEDVSRSDYLLLMPPLNFILLGLALLLADLPSKQRFHPREYLAVFSFLAAMLPFTSYLYGTSTFITNAPPYGSMARIATVLFLVSSSGILFMRPDRGWVRLAAGKDAAGVMMRLLLPLIVLALLALGWLRLLGEQYGVYTSAFGISFFVVVRSVIIGAVIIGAARLVHYFERARNTLLQRLKEANTTLEERVAERTAEIEMARTELQEQHDLLSKVMNSGGTLIVLTDRQGRILQFNRACEKTTGYKAEDVTGRVFWDVFLTQEPTPGIPDLFRPLFERGTPIEEETAWYDKAGKVCWVHWYGTALGTGSNPVLHSVIAGVDVTERRRAETRLREEEEQLQFILDRLPVGVILSRGVEQTMLYQNPCFVEMFGYTIHDFPVVADWWPLAYPEAAYREQIAARWNARIAEATLLQTKITPMEVYITARDSSVKYISVHAAVVGELNVVTFIDLTARRQAEEARRLNEMRLETLLKLNQMTKASTKELADFVLNEAVRLTDSTIGYLAFMNEEETVLNMYAWSHTAMKECAVQDNPVSYPVESTGLWGEAVRQRAPVITNDYAAPSPLKKGYPKGHVPIRRHMNIPVMDGDRIVIVAGVGNKTAPYDESDVRQLTLLMEGMWRILRRRENENAIKRMRSYLQNIVDSMPSVLVAVNLDGTVTHWNRAAADLTGINEKEAQGRDFGDLLPQLEGQLDKVRSTIRDGCTMENERFSTETAGEATRYFDLRVFPLVADGAQGAVIRLDDVTSRVQIEDMMVQTEKMMSVGGLAAGMAHEINNPLGGILQACQNIERRTSLELIQNAETARALGVDLARVRQYLQERGILEFVSGIRSDGMRAAQIVTDMLSFSRRSDSQFSPVHLPEVVETVLRLASNDYDLKKQFDFRNIKIYRDFQPDMPPVPCDKTKMEQVLLNLFKNAAQAMAGQTLKEPPAITVRIRQEQHHACIEVEDNGPGMEEAVRRRVFEPFFTTKEIGIGTGLGLSVSYFIITRLHRGAINVESTPGAGSRFLIQLPLEAEG